jgi:hypothetical protein
MVKLSTATQSEDEAQEMLASRTPGSIVVLVQVGLAAVGFVETKTLPAASEAAQKFADVHETPRSSALSRWVTPQVGLAAVGSVETNALPEPETATHSEVVGQDTSLSRIPVVSTASSSQLGLAANGFVERSSLPCPSTATQKDCDGQEAPSGPLAPVAVGFQALVVEASSRSAIAFPR